MRELFGWYWQISSGRLRKRRGSVVLNQPRNFSSQRKALHFAGTSMIGSSRINDITNQSKYSMLFGGDEI